MFVEIGRWRISAEQSQTHMDMWQDILAYQKLHPEMFLYTKTRLFRLDEAGAKEETWIWIDEYQDKETYDRQMKIMKEDPEFVAIKQKWHARFDPIRIGSKITEECWLEQLWMEFEGRSASS